MHHSDTIFTAQHAKCDGTSDGPCKRCRRTGEDCIRDGGSTDRFRSGSSARLDSAFHKNQVWVSTTSKTRELKYIDETDIIAADYIDLSDESVGASGRHTLRNRSATTTTVYDASYDCAMSGEGSAMPEGSGSQEQYRVCDPPRSTSLPPHVPELEVTRYVGPGWADVALSDEADISNSPGDFDSTTASGTSSPGPDHPRPEYRLDDRNTTRNTVSQRSSYEPLSRPSHRSNPVSKDASAAKRGQIAKRLFLLDTVKPPTSTNVNSPEDRLHATLLRYFSQEFTLWFDLCDPGQHFAQVVPQRARSSRPLLTAVLTLSARHLLRLGDKRPESAGIARWKARIKPELREETAVHYHNECIRDLLRLSMDPYQVHNEDLLAAAIILRTDEEMIHGTEEAGKDQQVFLHVINAFLNAQVPATDDIEYHSGHLSNSVGQASTADTYMGGLVAPSMPRRYTRHERPPMTWLDDENLITQFAATDLTPSIGCEGGLRQACFWIAFRQEIYASFIKQRPMTFPLTRCAAFRRFSPAEDAVWANRLIILCADVLEYCYGSTSDNIHHSPTPNISRWHELKNIDRKLTSLLPNSFEPTFFSEPEDGEVLPEIWYLEPWHATGIMHIELARILLAVWDPTRPKFGPGHLAATRELSATLKNIVLRLCGIAQGNQQSPPNFINAFMGISMGGEYFEERGEQQALVDVLVKIEEEYAYSTGTVLDSLKSAWGWNEDT